MTAEWVLLNYNDNCSDRGLILPIFPYESTWNRPLRTTLYFLGLLYCFLGIAIVADIFMSSIEKITSKTKKIYLSKFRSNVSEDTDPEFIEVRIWNDTVANLTLMALGSSAPEILLSIIETIGNGFKAGDLGPGTIVGSAAFNLHVITAMCIMFIPVGEIRRIKIIGVFIVTSIFSIFAYVWLIIILEFISPNEIEVWEAVTTLAFFPLLVFLAWGTDKGWKFRMCRRKSLYSPTNTNGDTNKQIDMDLETDDLSSKKKLLYTHDGKVNKKVLIEFYKSLRKVSKLTDEESALLAAVKLVENKPRSRLFYRIGAIRKLAGGRKLHLSMNKKLQEVYDAINSSPDLPDLGPLVTDVHQKISEGDKVAIVEFHTATLTLMENIGTFPVKIVRYGKMDNTVVVKIESFDGTAKAHSDYVPINQIVEFGPGIKEKKVNIEIVDDNQWEPDEEFFLRLSLLPSDVNKKDVGLGRLPIMEIVILDDDDPGIISFRKRGILVKESCSFAVIEIERTNGADGEVSVSYKTLDLSAKSPYHYIGIPHGEVTFYHGEILKFIEIPIVNKHDQEQGVCFEIELTETKGGAQLGRISKTAVTICDDSEFDSLMNRMMEMTEENLQAMEVINQTWIAQIQDALKMNGGDDDGASGTDYLMHFISFGWKVLFALIPPPSLAGTEKSPEILSTGIICFVFEGGWPCFFTSLAAIGMLTAIVGDLAGIFGCLISLNDTVTAITFVALGTSLPDLFASRTAATQEKHADNSIGNVTGSNSVNVFLGLGIPWSIASIYWAAKGGKFEVLAGDISFSVLVYAITAFITITILFIRRKSSFFGNAELGGSKFGRFSTGGVMLFLWFTYIILSSLQSYQHINFQLT